MFRFFQTITDPIAGVDVLRRRRYGLIEIVDGHLRAIHLRPWPKHSSICEARFFGRWWHHSRQGDRLWLYYNQPCGHSNYLALRYAVSSGDCRLSTLHAGIAILDEIARIKSSDAIFCQATSLRISERAMRRYGWEPLGGRSAKHTFVKRFYGRHPRVVPANLLAQPVAQ